MKIIVILLMIASPLLAQENQKSEKIWSPKVSIFSTMYGISDFEGSNLPLLSVGLDWMVGEKVYYYGKVQYNHRFGDFISAPEQFIERNSIQAQLLGIGFYLLDTRKQDLSTGWSMVMNFSFGLGVNLGSQNGYDTWINTYLTSLENMTHMTHMMGMLLYLPIDISLYTRYHINTASAVQFGINIAGHLGEYNRLLYGGTLGFAF